MKAETYVAACVAGVPKKLWEDMEGQRIYELVQELVGDDRNCDGQLLSIHGRIGHTFGKGTKPTPMQTLALFLYLSAPVEVDNEPKMTTTEFIQALSDRGWSDLVWWYDNVEQKLQKADNETDSTEWFDGA